MLIIAVAVAFVFVMCFATRAMDSYWREPANYRILYMGIGLLVGAIGYLITFTGFRLASLPLDTGLFFIYLLAIDCLVMIVGMLGIRYADWLLNRILEPRRPDQD
ncbi:MAG: hypothetical protein KBD06_02010 [Candidatus Pacebacteria bacterium]|nr:hypothetical protein [Candidatus Paceibacterota bacterium]